VKNILAKANLDVLERYAWSRTAVVFDFDGTLAPMVDCPADASMRSRTSSLLRKSALLCPVSVVSGRALPDLEERLKSIPLVSVFGNHGR
jgi:trehalose 6-phosphate phosphatase